MLSIKNVFKWAPVFKDKSKVLTMLRNYLLLLLLNHGRFFMKRWVKKLVYQNVVTFVMVKCLHAHWINHKIHAFRMFLSFSDPYLDMNEPLYCLYWCNQSRFCEGV